MVALLAQGSLSARGRARRGQDAHGSSFATGWSGVTSLGSSSLPIWFRPTSSAPGSDKATEESFDVEWGPMFANFVLADEINRAPAKVQAAMLEVMAEEHVSIGGVRYRAAAALHRHRHSEPDRVRGGLLTAGGTAGPVLAQVSSAPVAAMRSWRSPPDDRRPAELEPVLSLEQIIALQSRPPRCSSTTSWPNTSSGWSSPPGRPPSSTCPTWPRSSRSAAVRGPPSAWSPARALALIHGRDYVLPTDVQSVAKDVMSHRLVLGFDAVADNINPAQVIERIVAMVPPPTPGWNAPRKNTGHSNARRLKTVSPSPSRTTSRRRTPSRTVSPKAGTASRRRVDTASPAATRRRRAPRTASRARHPPPQQTQQPTQPAPNNNQFGQSNYS